MLHRNIEIISKKFYVTLNFATEPFYLFKFLFMIAKIIFGLAIIPFILVAKVLISIYQFFGLIFGSILVAFYYIKDKLNRQTKQQSFNSSFENNEGNKYSEKYYQNMNNEEVILDENDYYYLVLGVEKTASREEIKKAFRKKVIQYHPDNNSNENSQIKYQEIVEAHERLLGN